MNQGTLSKHFTDTDTFFARLAECILRWRWFILLMVSVTTIFAFHEMRKIKMDNSNESFFLPGDPTKQLMDKFRDIFGNDDFVYVLIETDNFFKPETIRMIKTLAEDLEKHVPHVKDVKFLGNVEYVEGVEDGIEISDLIEEIPETPEEMKLIIRRAMNEPLYLDNLISRDGRTAAILLECERYPDEKVDPRKEIPPALYKILAKPDYANLKVYTVGGPIIDYEFDEMTARETPLFGLICIGIQMLILFWVTRGVRGVIIPLMVVILSILWTLGLVGVLDWTLSLMVIMLPTLLICVGIGDSMHIISEFQDQRDQGLGRQKAIVGAIALVGTPCLLTSLTTAAGFLSFLSTVVKPIREMGVYAAIGVVMAFVLSVIVVPILFSFGKDRKKARDITSPANRHDLFDRILEQVAILNLRYPRAILGIFGALIALSLIGYSLVEVESNPMEMIKPDIPFRQAYEYVDSHMGGSMAIEIMLNTGKKDGIKEIEFLKQMEALQNHIDSHPLTMKTMSANDLLKKMRRAMHENQPEYYSLPETSTQAAQYLFLYETSGGKELDKYIGFNYDIARINARTKSLNTEDVRAFTADIDSFVKENIDSSIKVEETGTMYWLKAMSEYISHGQKRSFIVAFIAITIMMIIALRSFKLGLISMLPNIFPVLIGLGLIGYVGIDMAVPLMIFSPIIIGVAVDDTIHFFMRYRREFNRLGTYEKALKATLLTVGRPITFTTITLILGFSVFGLSNYYSFVHFGLMSAFAFLWALLADFFLAPAMLLVFKPLGKEKSQVVE